MKFLGAGCGGVRIGCGRWDAREGREEGVECVECVEDHQLGRLMDETPWHASNLEREAGAIASQQRLSRGR